MKKLFLLTILISQFAFAAHNDFSDSDTQFKPISVGNLRYKIGITGQILVFAKDTGRILFKANEKRKWSFGDENPIEANWGYRSNNLPTVALKHEWQVSPEGVLTGKIKQFESIERGEDGEIKTGKLIKEKDYKVENLDSISFVISEDDSKRVVAHFDFELWNDDEAAVDIGRLGINSPRMTVFDGTGDTWASRLDNSDGNNVYFGMITHKGSVFMSYVPFKGAKKIGVAERGRIRLYDGKLKLYIESSERLLPVGVSANVYGFFDLTRKTEKYNSVRSYGTTSEESFLKRINSK
jgi:hypothetical protein